MPDFEKEFRLFGAVEGPEPNPRQISQVGRLTPLWISAREPGFPLSPRKVRQRALGRCACAWASESNLKLWPTCCVTTLCANLHASIAIHRELCDYYQGIEWHNATNLQARPGLSGSSPVVSEMKWDSHSRKEDQVDRRGAFVEQKEASARVISRFLLSYCYTVRPPRYLFEDLKEGEARP